MSNADELEPSWLDQLIGTETCTYCDALTECLSLPNQEDTEYFACRHCIARAFDAIFSQANPDTYTRERPSGDGHYWMRWQGQIVGIFYVWRSRFWHGLIEQHPPKDAEWLRIEEPKAS